MEEEAYIYLFNRPTSSLRATEAESSIIDSAKFPTGAAKAKMLWVVLPPPMLASTGHLSSKRI